MTYFARVLVLFLAACGVAGTARAEPTTGQAPDQGAAPDAPTGKSAPAAAASPGSAPYPAPQSAPTPQSPRHPGAFAPTAPYPPGPYYPGPFAPYPASAPGATYPQRDAATRASGSAHPGDNFMARPLAMFGHLSLGGPYGMLGGSLDYSFSHYASVEGGAGLGGGGPEFGAMVLPRIPLSAGFAIGAGLGMAGEFDYEEPFACFMEEEPCTAPRWSFAPFAQGELYLEGRTRSGFSVRGYVGQWRLLSPTPDSCDAQTCSAAVDPSLPYFGVAFGGSLGL